MAKAEDALRAAKDTTERERRADLDRELATIHAALVPSVMFVLEKHGNDPEEAISPERPARSVQRFRGTVMAPRPRRKASGASGVTGDASLAALRSGSPDLTGHEPLGCCRCG